MFWRYLWRTLSRNKLRTFLVAIGIIVSVTMITGINVASNQMGTYQIVKEVDQVKNDFSFQQSGYLVEPGIPDTYTQDLAKLAELENELDEYLLSYASNFRQEENLYIQNSEEELNWTKVLSLPRINQTDYVSPGNLYAFGENIFNHPQTSSRFSDLISSNTTFDFSKPGVYVDITTANSKNLTIGSNISIGVYRYTYQYDENTDKTVILNFTTATQNIPVLGVFSLIDASTFMESFGGYYWDEVPSIILGNLTYMENEIISPMREDLKEQLKEINGESDYYEQSSFRYHILIDHTAIVQTNPNTIRDNIEYIETRIKLKLNDANYQLQSNLKSAVMGVRALILIFQGLFVIVSIPVLILGWYLCKTNWILSYQRRRREMALLKTRGGYQRQLKTMFMYEALFIGVAGGLIGVIGGNLTAYLVLNRVYPDAAAFFAADQTIRQLFTGEYMSISTWIVGIIVGLGMSIFAVRKPLKQFAKLDPIEGLQKYSEAHHTTLEKRKSDVILLIIGIIPILNALVAQGFLAVNQDIYFNAFIMIIATLSTPLLPFAPFMVIYAIIRLVCRNEKLFTRFIKRISSIFNDRISLFTQKSIIRNQARSFRLVFIIAMALSFMVMATTIEGIETEYQEQIYSLETGDGIPLSVYYWGDLRPNVSSMISQFETTGDEYGLRDFTYAYRFSNSQVTSANAEYYNSLVAIDVEGFMENIELRDRWFVDMTAEEALTKLETIPNSTLIPNNFAEGYEINDPISVRYYDQDVNDYAEIVLTIVGIYDVCPLVYNQWQYERPVLVNTGTLNTSIAKVDNMILTFYDEIDDDFTVTADQLITAIESNDAFTGYVGEAWTISTNETVNLVTTSLLRYLNLQSFYLLTIVGFGVGIIMYISINEKSRDLSLLRARAVPKKVIYKIQLAEGLTLLLMSTIFISLGLLGGATMILQLNNLTALSLSSFKRSLMIPWGQIGLQVVGSLLLFMGCIALAVAIEIRKSDVSKITDVLRISA